MKRESLLVLNTQTPNSLDVVASDKSATKMEEITVRLNDKHVCQSAKFVVNPIIKVDGNESDESSSEEYDSSDEKDFDDIGEKVRSFPYRTFTINKTGEELLKLGSLNNKVVSNLSTNALAVAHEFLHRLHSSGLENKYGISEKIEDVVSVSMLLNRPWSISTRKNNLLKKKSDKTSKKLVPTTQISLSGKTEKSVNTTEKSVSSAEKSVSSSEKSVTETEKSVTTTEKSVTRTENSVTTTEKSVTTTEKSATTTEKPVFTNQLKADKFGIFWEFQWYDKNNKKVKYEKVKTFYKKLKHYDKVKGTSKSEDFKNISEKGIPPYRSLREKAKNHENTKKQIKSYKDCNVYLSLVDSDTVSFNGIYSAYLRIHKKYQDNNNDVPTVMSTGYEYPMDAEYGKALKLASHVDRMIRVITAKHLPLGVYYPEPNTCILILQGRDTLEESFINKKKVGNNELPSLLKDIQKKREKVSAIFSDDKPLITALPDKTRTKLNKIPKKFSDQFKNGGSATPQDLNNLKAIHQTHLNNYVWCLCLSINAEIEFVSDAEHGYRKRIGFVSNIRNNKNKENAIIEIKKCLRVQEKVDLIITASTEVNKYIEEFKRDCIKSDFYHY